MIRIVHGQIEAHEHRITLKLSNDASEFANRLGSGGVMGRPDQEIAGTILREENGTDLASHDLAGSFQNPVKQFLHVTCAAENPCDLEESRLSRFG